MLVDLIVVLAVGAGVVIAGAAAVANWLSKRSKLEIGHGNIEFYTGLDKALVKLVAEAHHEKITDEQKEARPTNFEGNYV